LTAIGLDIGGTSIKAALVRGRAVVSTTRSISYERPSRSELQSCLEQVCAALGELSDVERVGLCLPGILAPDRSMVVHAVNIPGLEGVPLGELVRQVLGRALPCRVFNDAHASTFGYWMENPGEDRLLGLALGTGIGACVLDGGQWLRVTGASSGHIGQIDVGPCSDTQPLGPDGGRNSLEGYLGIAALRDRYGEGFADRIGQLGMDEPPMKALIRAVRICHAIYQPARVVLLGGVGIRMAGQRAELREAISCELTCVAVDGWTLEAGSSDYHAAAGAAWLAR